MLHSFESGMSRRRAGVLEYLSKFKGVKFPTKFMTTTGRKAAFRLSSLVWEGWVALIAV